PPQIQITAQLHHGCVPSDGVPSIRCWMLTIRAAQNAPYYEQREFLRDDYYLEHDHAPGTWVGRGAELLELEGAPERGALGALLEGAHPASGERLPGLSSQRKNAGFDLTLTAPKSVSVLMAVGN